MHATTRTRSMTDRHASKPLQLALLVFAVTSSTSMSLAFSTRRSLRNHYHGGATILPSHHHDDRMMTRVPSTVTTPSYGFALSNYEHRRYSRHPLAMSGSKVVTQQDASPSFNTTKPNDGSTVVAVAINADDGGSSGRKSDDTKIAPPQFKKISKAMFNEILGQMKEWHKEGKPFTQSYVDAMMGICVSLNEWDAVLEILDIMKEAELTQERSTYVACLQACHQVGNGASAEEILTAMESAYVLPKASDFALVISAMCRNAKHIDGDGSGGGRRSTRNKNKSKGKSNNNNNKNAGTKGEQERSAKEWIQRAWDLLLASSSNVVDEESVIPIEAYDAVLSGLRHTRQWQQSLRLLRLMESESVHPNPHSSSYLISIEACVASGKPESAFQIIVSMRDAGITPTSHLFGLVIKASAKRLQWRRALQLLQMMEELDVPRTVIHYNTVIGSCAKAREVGTAKSLLYKMRKQGIKPDVVSFNSVMGACANTNRWRDALTVLDQCNREPGVTPDIYTYTNAMRACAKGGLTRRALNLLEVVKDKGLPLDGYCYTAVIDACSKARMWKKALSLLDEMKENGIKPTQVTYSVAISACGNGDQWRKALALLDEMKEQNMKINLITYNNAITALSKASRKMAKRGSKKKAYSSNAKHGNKAITNDGIGTEHSHDENTSLFDLSMSLIKQMKQDGVEPDGFSFTSAISCCGAEGRWQEALDMIRQMRKGGPKTRPNKMAYTAAITACGRAGEYTHALELFRSMKDEGLAADRVAYNALFSALRIAEQPDAAFELWGEMCGHRSSSTRVGQRKSIATARDTATPDIITVTDCVGTLSHAEQLERIDEVFSEAVERGIVLKGPNDSLDSDYDIDLSGMSFPVARAAVRYMVHQIRGKAGRAEEISDVSFITGVGVAHTRPKPEADADGSGRSITSVAQGGSASAAQRNAEKANVNTPKEGPLVSRSLRDYVQEVLRDDFQPSIESSIPPFQKGTVLIEKKHFGAGR